jgi:hypothetical protein
MGEEDYIMVINDKLCRNGEKMAVVCLKTRSH